MSKMYDKFYIDFTGGNFQYCSGMVGRDGDLQCFSEHDESPLFPVDNVAEWKAIPEKMGDSSSLSSVTVVLSPDLSVNEVRDILLLVDPTTYLTVDAIVQPYMLNDSIRNSTMGFSPLPKQPQNDSDLYAGRQPEWNPNGVDLFGYRLPLFFVMGRSNMTSIYEKAVENREDTYSYPIWSAQYNFEMQSKGKDLVTCLADDTCTRLMGITTWGITAPMVPPATPPAPQKPIIAITVPVSGTSLYTRSTVLAEASIRGTIIAAIGVIDMLSEVFQSLDHDLLFLFFDTEQYGYAGSLTYWHDVIDYTCIAEGTQVCGNYTHLDVNRISHLIALDQLGVVPFGEDPPATSAFTYFDQTMYDNTEAAVASGTEASNIIKDTLEKLNNNGAKQASTNGNFLPPSALHPFLKHAKQYARTNLSAITIAGYDGTFNNKYYGSMYDGIWGTQLNATVIGEAASVVASTLFAIGGGVGEAPSVNATFMEEMTECVMGDVLCPYFMQYLSSCGQEFEKNNFARGQTTMYPPANTRLPTNPISLFLKNFMRDKLALPASSNEACDIEELCKKTSERNGTICSNPIEVCFLRQKNVFNNLGPFLTPKHNTYKPFTAH